MICLGVSSYIDAQCHVARAKPVTRKRKMESMGINEQKTNRKRSDNSRDSSNVEQADTRNEYPDLSSTMFRFLFSPPICKPDTIAEFPFHTARCVNSGDFRGLSNLVNKHLHEGCDISMSYSRSKLNLRTFVKLFELLDEAHPDRIMSVQKLVAKRNQIEANVYMKFTDCKPLYESVARTIKDPAFVDYFPPSRAEILKRRMRTAQRPDQEREKLEGLLESDCDIVVYGCVQMILTIDDMAEKATEMKMICDLNFAHIANENCF